MRIVFINLITLSVVGIFLLGTTSCSKGPSEEEYQHIVKKDPVKPPVIDDPKPVEIEDFSETIKKGDYKIKFSPVNPEVVGVVTAEGKLSVTDTEVTVEINAENFPVNTIHAQYVHTGSRCPSREDDSNNDGVVDMNEALQVSKQIVIPLDGDISTQLLDSYLFPVSDPYGMYFYKQTAPVTFMANDLRNKDENIEDSFIKIGRDGKLNLEKKVVIIYGVGEDTDIPTTVSSTINFSQKASIPIACGKILKASDSI